VNTLHTGFYQHEKEHVLESRPFKLPKISKRLFSNQILEINIDHQKIVSWNQILKVNIQTVRIYFLLPTTVAAKTSSKKLNMMQRWKKVKKNKIVMLVLAWKQQSLRA
jgi:hypothetical protein